MIMMPFLQPGQTFTTSVQASISLSTVAVRFRSLSHSSNCSLRRVFLHVCADLQLALPQGGNFNRPGNDSSAVRIFQSAESFPSFLDPTRQAHFTLDNMFHFVQNH
jgi:hypothetical protein